jgi:hypothetical protein
LVRFTNRATVTANEADLIPDDNVAESILEVRAVDLAILDWHPVGPVVEEHPVRFELTLTNRGPHAATAVRLAYALPANAAFISALNPAGSCTMDGASVVCELAELGPGESVLLALVLRPAPGVPLALEATATSAEGELEPGDNTVQVVRPVERDADLALTCLSDDDLGTGGGFLRWVLTVTNQGPHVAEEVRVATVWPAGAVTVVTLEPASDVWEVGPEGAEARLGRLQVGESATVALTLGADAASLITLQAHARAAQPDLEETDNTCATAVEVLAPADLAVQTKVSPDPRLGVPLTCMITLTNRGPGTATAIVLSHEFSAGLGFLDASPSAGRSLHDDDQVRWELDTLAPGAGPH